MTASVAPTPIPIFDGVVRPLEFEFEEGAGRVTIAVLVAVSLENCAVNDAVDEGVVDDVDTLENSTRAVGIIRPQLGNPSMVARLLVANG